MGLSIEDRLKHFVPARLYYPYKVGKEKRRGEPELTILHDLVRTGCTAIDVGANRGYYSYALAKFAKHVEAFEPNAALAQFARRKLGSKVRVHQVAVANRDGQEKFYLPQTTIGIDSHLIGNLGNRYPTLENVEYDVRVATLDSFAFDNVGFIKIDVEGVELAVIEGAKHTIARWQPNLVVELLVDWHDARSLIVEIINMINYSAFILIDGQKIDAFEALTSARLAIKSYNVIFVPITIARADQVID